MNNIGVIEIDGAKLQFFSAEFDVITMPTTVVSGSGILKKGTILGRVTASRKFAPYNAAVDPHDGTEVARRILAEDVDATAADVQTSAFVTGVFNTAALTGLDQAGQDNLEDRSIFVKDLD